MSPSKHPEIIKSFDDSIFQQACDISDEIISSNIDELLDLGITNIPIFKELIVLYKEVLGIRELLLIRKISVFIKQYNSGSDSREVRDFVSNILCDKKFRFKVLEFLLSCLDRFDTDFKAQILAELLLSWFKGEIDEETFLRLSYHVERTNPSVFRILYDCHKLLPPAPPKFKFIQCGVFPDSEMALLAGCGFAWKNGNQNAIWQDAISLCEFGLKPFYDDKYAEMPKEIDDYLKDHWKKILNDSSFKLSFYENSIISYRAQHPSWGLKFRIELLNKILGYIRSTKTI